MLSNPILYHKHPRTSSACVVCLIFCRRLGLQELLPRDGGQTGVSNVASRMFSGNSAYDGTKRLFAQRTSTETNLFDEPLEDNCRKYFGNVISGACSLNFVTLR